ncbi:tripartite tricarboxylate transporter substrate binding protein [soil metagenome]
MSDLLNRRIDPVDRMRRNTMAVAAMAMLLSAGSARAAYPEKAINLIVPFPPGGRTDLTARVVAAYLKEELGQPVVVVNKAGAGGVLGAGDVARADPDGYSIGFFSTGFLTTQYTVPTPTDVKLYELISLINYDPAAIAVSTARGWKSIADVVAAGKAKPKSLRVGINPGSSAHIFAAAFVTAAGLDVTFVPFRGGSERAAAIGGGHIDLDFDIVASMKAMRDAGKIDVLAIAGDRRDALYPEIPTMRESGVDLVISSWHGLFAPKGTPPAMLQSFDAAMAKVAAKREFIEQMTTQLLGIRYLDRTEFTKFFAAQDVQYKQVIDKLELNKTSKVAA